MGADKVKDLRYFQPANPDLTIDPAIDSSLLTREILELYNAFRTPLKFTSDELSPLAEAREPAWNHADIGSNNWVVRPKLTASGYPLLMNDPHRSQQAPSLRYWVHLVAPGWDVIGGGEPSLPASRSVTMSSAHGG